MTSPRLLCWLAVASRGVQQRPPPATVMVSTLASPAPVESNNVAYQEMDPSEDNADEGCAITLKKAPDWSLLVSKLLLNWIYLAQSFQWNLLVNTVKVPAPNSTYFSWIRIKSQQVNMYFHAPYKITYSDIGWGCPGH
ncbi:unnamed protein product [Urochloa humidicola]